MAIVQLPNQLPAQVGIAPAIKQMVTTDNLATVSAAGYLNQYNLDGNTIAPTDLLFVIYDYNAQTNSGTFGFFLPTISNGVITLVSREAINVSTAAAAPGTIRALVGSMTDTATVMTSGNLVGVRGVVNYVGASGGFLYGTQGKLVPTGTLSGSSWNAALFGQFDVSAATINAGQLAAIWGDWGATGAVATNMTGARLFAGTNTTSNILNAQIYLFGGATNLLELNDNVGGVGATYITAGGGGAPGGTIKKLAISINGVTYYIVASTTIT